MEKYIAHQSPMKRITDEKRCAQGWKSFLCLDCQQNTNESEEYYMLKDRIWCSINPKVAGMLCLHCAERRLKRKLVRTDFSDAPINVDQAKLCRELAIRLSRFSVPVSKASRTRRAKRRSRNL
jgi:hypothetical protein